MALDLQDLPYLLKHHGVMAVSIKWNVTVLPAAHSQAGPSKCPSPPPADAGR